MIHLISLPSKSPRSGRAWCPGGLTRPLWLGEEEREKLHVLRPLQHCRERERERETLEGLRNHAFLNGIFYSRSQKSIHPDGVLTKASFLINELLRNLVNRAHPKTTEVEAQLGRPGSLEKEIRFKLPIEGELEVRQGLGFMAWGLGFRLRISGFRGLILGMKFQIRFLFAIPGAHARFSAGR